MKKTGLTTKVHAAPILNEDHGQNDGLMALCRYLETVGPQKAMGSLRDSFFELSHELGLRSDG